MPKKFGGFKGISRFLLFWWSAHPSLFIFLVVSVAAFCCGSARQTGKETAAFIFSVFLLGHRVKAGSLGDIGDGDPLVPGEEVVALVLILHFNFLSYFLSFQVCLSLIWP